MKKKERKTNSLRSVSAGVQYEKSERNDTNMSPSSYSFSTISSLRDPRTLDWMSLTAVPVELTLLIGYVYFVKYAGPYFMKNRKPYENIKPIIQFYNVCMVLINIYFVKNLSSRSYFGGGYNAICQGIDYEAKDETTTELLELFWLYHWVRIADLLDTIFFVLRKKDSNVTFLHVAHHVIVVSSGLYGLMFGADGQAVLGVILNSSIHVIMYTYYFLALLGPAVRPHLWWKRYLTQLQMVQFVVMMIHNTIPLFINCRYPVTHAMLSFLQVSFILVMFFRFYVDAYSSKQASSNANGDKYKLQ